MTAPHLKFTFTIVLLVPACESTTTEQSPNSGDKIYVANEEEGTLSVIDGATNRVLTSVDLGEDGMRYLPHNVQVAPDGRSVWAVAIPEGGHAGHGEGETPEKLIVLDPVTDTIMNRISLGTELHVAHVVLDPASTNAYVTANEADEILEIDAARGEIVRRFALAQDSQPHGLRYCGGKLFVANMGSLGMSIVDLSDATVTNVALGAVAVQTACSPDGRFAFASLYDSKEVARYEIATGEIVRVTLPAESQGPVQLYPTPDSARLYVADQGILMDRPASNRLFEIDVEEAEVVATIEVGEGAHGVVVSDDGNWAYVTNIAEGTVSVVDTSRRVVAATIEVGASPNGVSHLHEGGGMP